MPVIDQDLSSKASAECIRTGLLGRGILASRSPWLHEKEAIANGLALTYELFDFSARNWPGADLGDRLKAIEDRGFSGVNVTFPFKQEVMPLLDELTQSALSVGAVNTVHFADGKRIGHNTDVTGFAESVREGLSDRKLDRVVQFGAGGAGSATASALLDLGTNDLILVESDVNRAQQLLTRLQKSFPAARVSCEPPAQHLFDRADGVVNATPVGMAAHPGTPFDPDWLGSNLWVADIVYVPLETELLKQARARGCHTLNGRRMAVYQAAQAFDIFTGVQADRPRMLASFDAFQIAQPA